MSKEDLSADTEVVLLLCGRFGGEKNEAYLPLAPREYGELAKWLKALELRPSDLLVDAGRVALSRIQEARLDRLRVEFLLGRGTAMALALERWARGGLWVISRGDEAYPQRLKRRLKNAAPPLLYGAGDKALLDKGGLAIIGSRDVSPFADSYTRSIAARCAKEGLTVVSGGARGVDTAAMQGVAEAGGYCVGVLPSDLLKTSINRQNRMGLQEGHLALVSPFYPEAGFGRGANAMARNRYIYTLADHALVIDSALGKNSGTWTGAVENLKYEWVPLYVRTPGEGAGNVALLAEGALPFTLPEDSPGTLLDVFGAQTVGQSPSESEADVQQSFPVPEFGAPAEAAATELPSVAGHQESLAPPRPEELEVQPTVSTGLLAVSARDDFSDTTGTAIEEPPVAEQPVSVVSSGFVLDMYAEFSSKLALLLSVGALSEEEIAMQLFIEKSQAKAWLKRAIEDGLVDKLKKPVRYKLSSQGSLC